MRKQKPRNAFVTPDAPYTDLGVISMSPTKLAEEPKEEKIESRYLLNDSQILNPQQWTTRNKVIVRNS